MDPQLLAKLQSRGLVASILYPAEPHTSKSNLLSYLLSDQYIEDQDPLYCCWFAARFAFELFSSSTAETRMEGSSSTAETRMEGSSSTAETRTGDFTLTSGQQASNNSRDDIQVDMTQLDAILAPGSVVMFDTIDHGFTVVVYDEAIYVLDYYYEADRKDVFRVKLVTKAELVSLIEAISRYDLEAFLDFFGVIPERRADEWGSDWTIEHQYTTRLRLRHDGPPLTYQRTQLGQQVDTRTLGLLLQKYRPEVTSLTEQEKLWFDDEVEPLRGLSLVQARETLVSGFDNLFSRIMAN